MLTTAAPVTHDPLQVKDISVNQCSLTLTNNSTDSVFLLFSVMMAFSCQCVLFFCLLAAFSVYAGTDPAIKNAFTAFFFVWFNVNFFSPWQTWDWTAGLILWPWCGLKAESTSTHHSFVWAAVFLPVSQPWRLFSVWIWMTVTSTDWWVERLGDNEKDYHFVWDSQTF